MKLTVAVAAGEDVTPDSQTAIDAAHSAFAQQASTWTDPVFAGETLQDGVRLLTYTADAVPRGIVTTGNVSPVLLPPHVV